MLFTTTTFAVFFLIVFAAYYLAGEKRRHWQNVLLLAASYVFYCWWDWRFGFLLVFSTLLDFACAHAIVVYSKNRKAWLGISITANLLLLGVFKYYDFFASSLAGLITGMGLSVHLPLLKLILPVGISFYTFHGLSYIIDVYNKRLNPCRNIVDYSLFVSFFPLLVAGPIERATHLLPQIQAKRSFDYGLAVNGLQQLLWGLVKKLVIADNCAYFANYIFGHYTTLPGSSLLLGALFFSFQIYGDFSGYTDIASGVAKLLGFRLLRNFDFPYFSRSIAEFWRKWHISLTSWFRDYLYIPLGGSKEGRARTVRNVFIVFLVSGLWHGAGFTFIIWGLLHALYFLPGLLLSRNREYASQPVAEAKVWPSWRDLIKMSTTFGLVTLAWIFFRAESLVQAADYCRGLASRSLFSVPLLYNFPYAATTLLLLVCFIIIEWRGRNREFAIEGMAKDKPKLLRWVLYCFLVFAVLFFMNTDKTSFIYFRF